MRTKNLLLIVLAVIVAVVLGLGGLWLTLGGKHTQAPKEEETLTSTVDLFQLTLPCKRNAEGNTPIVHADFQLVVPLKHRMKIEESSSRVRDIIATLLRNTDIEEINRDNLVGFKQQIIQKTRESLGVEIQEVLVLRFDYDILRQRNSY